MRTIRIAVLILVPVAIGAVADAQPAFSDTQAIVEFQRALDTYAFHHRQVERRAGESASERAMAAGMRASRPTPQDGDLFTPLVAAAFHVRITAAVRGGACTIASNGDGFVVPRPNHDATGTAPIPQCLAAVLPKLPAELEYRVAGVVLLLVDTHANLVVDVLHGAFPRRDN
jgi:hypothetical protein